MKDFGIITNLAWRNVWRNKRRTILTLLTIVVGCSMIIFMNSFAKGGHDQMIEDAVSLNVGHIQIHEKGYWDNQTIDYAFRVTPELLKAIKNDERVIGYAKRIQAGGLLSFKNNTAGALIQGIIPEQEKEIAVIHKKILRSGRFIEDGDTDKIVIGRILAKNLRAKEGDTISIISQGFDGSIAARRMTIVGLLKTGNPEYDRSLLMMHLEDANKMFTMMDFVHSITVRLADTAYTNDVRDDLIKAVSSDEIEVMGWDELMPELVQFIVMDDMSAYIFDIILFLVVAFGILNTIQMAVFERIREFGVMLSIGTKPGQVIRMVLMESAFISIMGIILGVALGWSLGYYFELNPLDYSDYSKEMEVWGVSTTIFPADTTALNLTVTSILTFVLSLLFSIFPARRAAKLKPVEAIRHL